MNKSKSDLVKLSSNNFFFLLLCSLVSFVCFQFNRIGRSNRAQGQVVPATKAKVIQSNIKVKLSKFMQSEIQLAMAMCCWPYQIPM